MTEFPENPFEPGAGTMPAHMGRRPATEDVLSGILRKLRVGRRNAYMAFLYGPRGNGKTVLLQWLEDEAAKRGPASDKRIVQVRISRTEMVSPASVAQTILNATPDLLRGLKLEADIGVPGFGSVRLAGAGQSQSMSLAEVLSKNADPFLITLDEAHEAPPDMLGGLLDVVQIAGRHRPIAAVFAGTPELEATLLDAHASFWSRGEKLRIGLLSDASAREALARPFRDAGLGADDEAVAELAVAADNYPFFLQLNGRAAWRMVEASGGRTLLPEHVEPALAAACEGRQDYCFLRHREFSRAKLLPLARMVAEAFVENAEAPADRRLSDAALEDILARHGDASEAGAFLAARGYVWQDMPGDPSWTPGIPSLMEYMLARIPAP